MSQNGNSPAQLSPLKRAFLALEEMQTRLDAVEAARTEPIAIVGVGCRFPGGVQDPQAFWRLLRDGVDAITAVPPERWDAEAFFDPDPATPGKMTTRWGGFLNQVDQFDAAFFGISPRDAARIDPQQRVLLEVAWEALEHAGETTQSLADSRAGVFIGIIQNDYGAMAFADLERMDVYAATGAAHNFAANRLSYLLNLTGPSLAIDTACSSSLVAIHLACQALRNQECNLALAGGVNLILSPIVTIALSKGRVMAPDGRCKTFDSRADGYVRSEGCAVVVLKRLSDAVAAGDHILALIRGSAVNQDGRSSGLTVPNGLAQQAVISQALRNAGVRPEHVTYVEAHGTGTALGDPIEVDSLSEVIGQPRPDGQRCAVGSVKTNIGHLEAAAGVAGLIKLVLCLQNRQLPPHLHLSKLNPHITLDQTCLTIPTELQPWSVSGPRRYAGVSSFGFGGTNAHVILEEVPDPALGESAAAEDSTAAHLLPLSARSAEALRSLAQTYAGVLETDTVAVPDLAYTASLRRTHHEHRLAVVGRSCAELARRLAAFAQGEADNATFSGCAYRNQQPRVTFVCSGQGSQWPGMHRQLFETEPVFRLALEECDALFGQHAPWSLLHELTADEAQSRLGETEIAQPAIFAVQIGLAALWRSWGVVPDAVVGHSVGEIAAAYIAGVLSLPDAVRIVFHRGRLMQRATGRGQMAAVELPVAEVERLLSGYEDQLAIAAINGPTSTVLSGDSAALAQVLAQLTQRQVVCRALRVNYAFHSPQMAPFRDELVAALAGIEPKPADITIVSSVTGRIHDGRDCDPDYWGRNLCEPVRFWPAISELCSERRDAFVEIGGHPVLLASIEDCLRQSPSKPVLLPSLRRGADERSTLLGSAAALYALGCPLDWQRFYPSAGRWVRLPSYPWQRKRFWLDENTKGTGAVYLSRPGAGAAHPLLGPRLRSSVHADTHFWEVELNTTRFPYLADHRVEEAVVFPAAAYIEMALAAAAEVFPEVPHTVTDLSFAKVLVLSNEETRTLQLVLAAEGQGSFTLRFMGLAGSETGAAPTLHATAVINVGAAAARAPLQRSAPPATIQARCPEPLAAAALYDALRACGLDYGESFQCVGQIWRGEGEALAQLQLPEPLASSASAYRVHPALLDGAFQAIGAALSGAEVGDTHLPVGVDAVHVDGRAENEIWAHAVVRSRSDATVVADVSLMRADGTVVLAAHGLRAQRLSGRAAPSACEYALAWQPQARPEPSTGTDQRPGTWLLLSERAGCGAALAAALRARGEHPVLVHPGPHYAELAAAERYELDPNAPEDFARLLSAVFHNGQPACRAVVHLWGLEEGAAEDPAAAEARAAERLAGVAARCSGVLHLVQALARAGWRDAPRLWVVTAGAQAVANESPTALAQAPLWGLGKVIALEHPEWRCTLLDVAPASDPTGTAATLLAELCTDSTESAIALRPAGRFVPRLVHAPALPATAVHRVAAHGQPYRVEIAAPGILDQLELRACARRPPGPGEVEIQVEAAALNFKDVLLAMGVVPAPGPVALGGECAGTVTAVGAGVNTVALGAAVVAIAPWSFARFVTTPATLVLAKPAGLSFAQAAALPLVSMTAHYALCQVGRLQAGERVLIHAAAGGVGLAAVHLAQQLGAEIFATAGSAEKRAYLESLGVAHVLDSRSLEFAAEVLRRTAGHGVDVVVNSLAGAAALSKNLEALGPYGRFVEIGVRDLYANTPLGLAPFQKGLSYTAIDLGRLARERPAQFAALFHTVMAQVADGQWPPLPLTVFPISQVAAACRHMAQAKHIGKVVLTLDDPEVRLAPASTPHFRADATYLITGGLGGLGLTVAQWLVTHGARHLLLVGRRGAPPAAAPALAALRAAGAVVEVAAVDVADRAQLHALLTADAASRPPVAGVIHAAAVLDDGVLLRLDRTRFASVLAPKLAGAWNLHQLTRELPLDFFVLFSSAAALLGSPGQANYSAANAFLDALAHYRRAHGLPALSINWGPWAEVGLAAAAATRGERLAFRGLRSLSPAVATAALGRLLSAPVAQMGVLDFDLRQWCQYFPAAAELPVLAELAQEIARPAARAPSPLRAELAAAEPARRRELLDAHLRQQIGRVLGMAPSQIDPRQPLTDMGIDSLMAVELRNRLETTLQVSLSATLIFGYPTLDALVPQMARKMGLPLDGAADGGPERSENAGEQSPGELDQLEDLSADDARTLLADELNDLPAEFLTEDHP